MGIDINRLSLAALKQIAEKMMRSPQSAPQTAPLASRGANGGKYHNQPAMRGSIRFDSQKEARRYDELMLMLKAGEIRELKLQPQFTLQEAYTTPEGNRVRAIRYQADFSYLGRDRKAEEEAEMLGFPCKTWALVVEDVKSAVTKTRVYEIKKKLMRERFGIEITEVE